MGDQRCGMLAVGKSFRNNGFKMRALPEDHKEYNLDSLSFGMDYVKN